MNKVRMDILEKLYAARSNPLGGLRGNEICPLDQKNEYIAETSYLNGKGFIEAKLFRDISGDALIKFAKITEKGIDFLEGEEGYVTVKLHDDTIEALRNVILSAIYQSGASTEQKSAWKTAIDNAPTAVVGAIVKDLVSLGLAKIPESMSLLQKYLL